MIFPVGAFGADSPDRTRAGLEVSGLGWWESREMRRALERLLGEERGATVDANAIEDAVFLMMSALENDGYLNPQIDVALVKADGTSERFSFDETLATLLPRPLEAKEVRFEVTRGVRYRVSAVEFTGLKTLAVEDAVEVIRPSGGLLPGGMARIYAPGRLQRALDVLLDEFHQRGYAEAAVTVRNLVINDATGDVDLAIEVREGPRSRVASLAFAGDSATGIELNDLVPDVARSWTYLWQQDVLEEIRRRHFAEGYPDVQVRMEIDRSAPLSDGERPVAVTARITTGSRVTVGQVRFTGVERTRESVLQRRVSVESGEPLNPLVLERTRYRLGQLGIFDGVDLQYLPETGEVRDPVFFLNETAPWEASLLAGYGSYERLRAGVELRQMNLFGRAHQSRLLLVQSFKSSRGDYTYTMPELFGETLDASVNVFGLQRDERAFLRQEYGGGVTLRRPLPWIRADALAGFTYQALRSKENELTTREVDEEQVTVASLDLGLTRDTRDNPLRPHTGYRWFMQLEAASRSLGGEVDYQRMELGLAVHRPWGRARWIHAGLTHGVLTTFGVNGSADPPVNKRFFPGGDASIRGYPSGSASPRAADGRFIGAKSYVLANLEVEQTVVGNWTAVLFADALGTASRLAEYPFDEELYSVGLGVRYQSLVGPIRLEYGRNVSPREGDPSGTLHFSVGFPF
ncbi:hypothetical protein MASR2M8_11520 [Opitutaceae bacterium]